MRADVSGFRWPERVALARIPTPVSRLGRLSTECGREIWIKRDDLTGAALSGNKVRKLEFLLSEAVRTGAERVLTCGGVQSNHARATAVAAARMGLSSLLYLRGAPPATAEGNVLLDRLAGAEIEYVTPEQYRGIDSLMAKRAELSSPPAYVIPEGGSNALGAMGYALAVPEILGFERKAGFRFDAVVHAVGSGGTSAGLILGKRAFGLSAGIHGVNVCDDEAFFKEKVTRILAGAAAIAAPDLEFTADDVRIIDGHVGPGYAQNEPEDFDTIRRIARLEGIFLDPVYTGKAMKGMLREIRAGGRLAGAERILFLHTGGIFGLFPRAADLLAD